MIRTRVTVCVLVLLAAATAASVATLHEVLLARVDERVEDLAASIEPLPTAAQPDAATRDGRRRGARRALDRAAAGRDRPSDEALIESLTVRERDRVEEDVRLIAIVSASVLLLAALLALPLTGLALAAPRRRVDTSERTANIRPPGRPPAQPPADAEGPVGARAHQHAANGATAASAGPPPGGERPEPAVTLEPGPLDLDLFTQDLFAKAPGLGDRDWRLDGTGAGIVVADRRRLTQALMNAAENAIARTDPGDPVWLGSSLVGDRARLWVRDRGRDVDRADQRRIFGHGDGGEPSRSGGGAGPGLAGVRAIVEAHGGRVELDCPPGLGSTLTIILPAAAQEASALRRSKARMPSGPESVQS